MKREKLEEVKKQLKYADTEDEQETSNTNQ